jgi:hypothetical protein
MSSIDNIVNDFNIGFFTTNNNKNPIDLDPKNAKYADFEGSMKVVNSEAYTPSPSEYVQVDGFRFDDNKAIPTKITLEGVFAQDSFLDKDGNWDEEAEYEAYAQRELSYKKEVISNWMEERGYEVQNNATLMKALLAKADNQL